jgi:uncharacterized protein (TIGR02452 family)
LYNESNKESTDAIGGAIHHIANVLKYRFEEKVQSEEKKHMNDYYKKNEWIFEDTLAWISENGKLQGVVRNSFGNQKIYLETDDLPVPENRNLTCRTIVSMKRSLEAASEYSRAGKKVCVLNPAFATIPCSGVTLGYSGREESFCRCSTLFPCLNSEECQQQFYLPHKTARYMLRNDDCIYTPDVFVIKDDSAFPTRMEEKDWYPVDIISCSPPNLRHVPDDFRNPGAGDSSAKIEDSELYRLLVKRAERIFQIVALHGAEVLILGPFGCKVYRNPPEVVAKAFQAARKKYEHHFETIEYAMFGSRDEGEYYDAFRKVI